ncbi:MFS transporter [Agrococcus versicolor]|uniref:MFS transporter n=2 Tax=Agrococcus versicolor TaxID=501482 RepID=A0ABN3AK84_9MICO
MLADGELSIAQVGLLGSVPLVVFAMFSWLVPALLRGMRITTVLATAMAAVVAGSALRLVPETALLYLGTALVAAGLCVTNVLLPVAARTFFPDQVGRVTGICTALISAGGGAGVALALPLTDGLDIQWRMVLAVTAAVSVVAVLAWLAPSLRAYETALPRPQAASTPQLTRVGDVLTAGIFFGAQASFFYLAASWLLPLLMEKSLSIEQAAFGVGAFSLAGVVTCLVTPSLALGRVGLRGMVVVAAVLQCAGAIGVLLGSGGIALGAAVVLAIGVTSAFSLSIVIFSITAESAAATLALSGRAQSVGYVVAGGLPFTAGLVRTLTGSWIAVEVTMLVLAAVTFVCGLLAIGRRRGGGTSASRGDVAGT